jgi:LysM repeat protein
MNKIDNSGAGIATLGRDEDAYMAHVAAGEMVVPPVISPETRARLFQEMQQVGLDPNEYTVGEGMSINPITGMPEFGFLKKVFKSVKKVAKKVAPIALPLVIPGVGGALSGALGGIGGAIGTGIKTLIPGSAGIVNAIGNVGSSILGGAEGIRKGIGSFASGMFGGPMNTPGINPAANYTIQPGDTLSEIAARAGTTVDALAKANNIANPNMIFAGQNLTIPTNPMTSGIGNFVRNIFGSGQNQNQGIFGGGAVNNLANLAIIKKILDQPTGRDPAELIPMGQSAFGYTPQQIANIPSYRIGNLTPALIEGQEYANVKPVAKAEAGGIMGLKAGGKIDPNRMDDDGPGDITPAFLEPGEFVMTRPATRVLGARNLYKLMKEAEQMA